MSDTPLTEETAKALLSVLQGVVGFGAANGGGSPKLPYGFGCASPSCDGDPHEVARLMAKSPHLAYAQAIGMAFDPFTFMVTTTFSASGTAVNPNQGSNKVLGRDTVIEKIFLDVQDPNAFVGNTWKAERDYYFKLSSGVQCQVIVEGENRWTLPYFPVAAIESLVSPQTPWYLTARQTVLMDFNVTTALPFAGTVFNVTYMGKTPTSDRLFGLTRSEVFNQLDKMGFATHDPRQFWGC